MRKHILTAIVFVATTLTISAQWCGTSSREEMIRNAPGMSVEQKQDYLNRLGEIDRSEQKVLADYQSGNRKAGKRIIPLVVHVLHQGGEENLTDEDIQWAVDQINLDYANSNPNRQEIIAPFKAIAGDMEIEFKLVTIDPDGNCTNGIVRHQVPNAYFNNQDNLIESYKVAFHWDVTKYFNIYTVGKIGCEDGGCTLGYAYPPYILTGGYRDHYGFVSVFGDFVKNAGTNDGTATHEIGHNLNLSHTWGSTNTPAVASNCNTDDGVDDTPNTVGNFSNCNKSAVNCGSLDNVQNYMDYSSCPANFTLGQRTVMNAAIDQYLLGMVSPANLNAVGANYSSLDDITALCEVVFRADGASEAVVCPGASVAFTDQSFHNPTSWNWTFEGATPSSSSDQNPTVVYTAPGSYSVTLEITNSSGTISDTRTQVVRVADNLGDVFPILESFEPYATSADQDLFIISNPENNNGFELTNTAGFASSKSFMLKNLGEGGASTDMLISNVLDISKYSTVSDMRFTFKYAFAGKSAAHTDKLSVAYSDDCGVTWKTRKTLSGTTLETVNPKSASFTPSSDAEWKSASVTMIGIQLNSNFRIRFTFEGSPEGNNFYLDDINLYHKDEVGITESTQLASSINLYPIPAKNTAKLDIHVQQTANYTIDVLDLTGRVVATVANEVLQNGTHKKSFKVSHFTNGVYLIRVTANGETAIKRLIVSN